MFNFIAAELVSNNVIKYINIIHLSDSIFGQFTRLFFAGLIKK